VGEVVVEGGRALQAGRWAEARAAFDAALARGETAEARFGLASALWWLGENAECVIQSQRAYALFRRSGDVEHAVQCALWLGIIYKANFANPAAANGWIGRADRLLESVEPGALHGYAWVARAYRMPDLQEAERLTRRAVDVARAAGDADLELEALSQLGLIRVGRGDPAAGFALIDEAMAAALGGEGLLLDTVVYTCCDMLNACELANDIDRAAQWCQAADDFVNTYGCPFLYAECRIAYGSVLAAKGRWADAERELDTGLRITQHTCPGLHGRALTRLAGLRIRQGRLEEAQRLLSRLDHFVDAEAEALLCRAALLLACGDAAGASRALEQRLHQLGGHRSHLCTALDHLVDAYVAVGNLDGAEASAARLADTANASSSEYLVALARRARARVAVARGETRVAVTELETALGVWSTLDLPFEAARTRFDLGRLLAKSEPDAAVNHARRALATFERLGAAADADRVAAYLRSLGVVARTGAKGVGLLTNREQEVLRLLGGGLSNPEIAERLHISRKTASHHVSNILSKLGLRNRAEAAAHAAATAQKQPPPSRQ
jgi:ATP/maltotriose-dependent transcriptional regulator MalT